jgi:hypothetical protein
MIHGIDWEQTIQHGPSVLINEPEETVMNGEASSNANEQTKCGGSALFSFLQMLILAPIMVSVGGVVGGFVGWMFAIPSSHIGQGVGAMNLFVSVFFGVVIGGFGGFSAALSWCLRRWSITFTGWAALILFAASLVVMVLWFVDALSPVSLTGSSNPDLLRLVVSALPFLSAVMGFSAIGTIQGKTASIGSTLLFLVATVPLVWRY